MRSRDPSGLPDVDRREQRPFGQASRGVRSLKPFFEPSPCYVKFIAKANAGRDDGCRLFRIRMQSDADLSFPVHAGA